MNDAPEGRVRPAGVTFLGWMFIAAAAAILALGAEAAVRGSGSGEPPIRVLIAVLFGRMLPAIWIGTAGWGVLKGRQWGRALIAALAVLSSVFVAGTVMNIGKSPQATQSAVVFLGIFGFTGGAALYLYGHSAGRWFK